MKTKLLSLLLAISMILSACILLASCSRDDDEVVTTVSSEEAWTEALTQETLQSAIVKITISALDKDEDDASASESMNAEITVEVTPTSQYMKMSMTTVTTYDSNGEEQTYTSSQLIEANITSETVATALEELGMSMTGSSASYTDLSSIEIFATLFDKATFADDKYTIKGSLEMGDGGAITLDETDDDTFVFEFADGKLAKLTSNVTDEDGSYMNTVYEFKQYGNVSVRPIDDTAKTAFASAKTALGSETFAMSYTNPTKNVIEDVKTLMGNFDGDDIESYTLVNSSHDNNYGQETEDMVMFFLDASDVTITVDGAAVTANLVGALVQGGEFVQLMLLNGSLENSTMIMVGMPEILG